MRTCTRTLSDARPHSKNSWWLYICVCVSVCVCVVAVGGHLSVPAAHFLKTSLPANKAWSLKWRKNTRESIIQLSRFPLSPQTEKNSESDRSVNAGVGERDCSYHCKLCNRQHGSVNPPGCHVFCGESARPRKSQKELFECSSQRQKEIIAEKLQTSVVVHRLLHNPQASLFTLRAPLN